jgi:hypothetical protein
MVYYARRSGVRLPLLCIRNVVTFTHHQNDTYVTLIAGVVVMQWPFTQCLGRFMLLFGQEPHAAFSFMFRFEIMSLIAIQSLLQIN